MVYGQLFTAIEKHVKLTEVEKDIIRSCSSVKKLRKHQYLLQEGNIAHTENFVIKGCLRSYEVNEKGQEHVIQFSVEEWWVGDLLSFLTEQPSNYNIDCLEDCELIQFTKADLNRLYDEVPKVERYFRILLQNAYIATSQRLLSAMSKTAVEQYAAFIKKYPHIERRITNKQIASYLGITPESLSRVRKQYIAPSKT
ncbi:Crp/Fnr family transcriptional regulator [Flavobacterium wongokense]|uniref:Crp/Fnr family transcriptional regulator n=1 Tax=Flavobacterium wongokense TaxID=2910674 RepID=UPI001F46E8D0|nr:Crp/Fnr family transcriptional regulator [Flavobacterium sp. WG47]MCF6132782.1 Crp/Fnr family transcriptional regulator [Flavobacterium sp. WG47]